MKIQERIRAWSECGQLFPDLQLRQEGRLGIRLLPYLFPIGKTLDQPWCPSIDGQIKKMYHIGTAAYYPFIKNDITSFMAHR